MIIGQSVLNVNSLMIRDQWTESFSKWPLINCSSSTVARESLSSRISAISQHLRDSKGPIHPNIRKFSTRKIGQKKKEMTKRLWRSKMKMN